MSDYRKILNQVGWVLIILGLVDILIMIYCIMAHLNYSSSFNIFAVIAGILLIKNNLKTVNIVTKFSGCLLGLFLGLIILLPLLISKKFVSIDLDYFKIFPNNLLTFIYGLFGFSLVWIYRSLRDESVVEAIQNANIKLGLWGNTPFYYFYLGLSLAILAALTTILSK